MTNADHTDNGQGVRPPELPEQPAEGQPANGPGDRTAKDAPEVAGESEQPRLSTVERKVYEVLSSEPVKSMVIGRRAGYRSFSYVRLTLATLISKGLAEYVQGRGYRRPLLGTETPHSRQRPQPDAVAGQLAAWCSDWAHCGVNDFRLHMVCDGLEVTLTAKSTEEPPGGPESADPPR